MTKPTIDIERLVAVETNLQNLTKAVESSTTETKAGFKDINNKLDVLLPTFITKDEFNRELAALKRRTIVQNILYGLLGSVISLLLAYFFANI